MRAISAGVQSLEFAQSAISAFNVTECDVDTYCERFCRLSFQLAGAAVEGISRPSRLRCFEPQSCDSNSKSRFVP
jgi:hypothetical protein